MAETQAGIPVILEPLVTRILAPNPSVYTYTGTQTYLVGNSDLAVIDPGPDNAAHIDAVLSTIAGRPLRAIVVTHHHRDHSPATRPLQLATGAPIVGASSARRGRGGPGDDAFDAHYAPDRVLGDGDSVSGDGWTLSALATPGHSSEHLAFALPEAGALFSGDHVMGWSTTVVSPPDGDMSDYMASLEKLLERDDRIYYPAHGDPIERPARLVRGMLGHKKQREGQILRLLREGNQSISGMVARMYTGLDPRLEGAAAQSVLAHLIDLHRRGMAVADGDAWRSAR